MIRQEDKLKIFKQMIMEKAELRKTAILSKVEQHKENELDASKEAALETAYNMMQSELSEIRSEGASELSQSKLEMKKRLYHQRTEYENLLFCLAKAQILSFAASEKYAVHLERKLKQLLSEYTLEDPTVQIKQQDMQYKDIFDRIFCESIIGSNYTIESSSNIELGGFIIQDRGLIIDMTLDSSLHDQREWFHGTSNLTINSLV